MPITLVKTVLLIGKSNKMLLYCSQTVADIILPDDILENNKTLFPKSVFYPMNNKHSTRTLVLTSLSRYTKGYVIEPFFRE